MSSRSHNFLFIALFWIQHYEIVVSSSFESLRSSSYKIGYVVRRAVAYRVSSFSRSPSKFRSFAQDGNVTKILDIDHGTLVSIDPIESSKDKRLAQCMELQGKTSAWDYLSYGFRMSMEAKNELNSSLERTQSLLTSSGGGRTQLKSSGTAFIASQATGSLETVGRGHISSEGSQESPWSGGTHPIDVFPSTSKIKNEESKLQMQGPLNNNLVSIESSTKSDETYHSSILDLNKSYIQTQPSDPSNTGLLRDNIIITSGRGPYSLRAFRKRAARITGAHGFFSGKRGEKRGYEPMKRLLRDQELNESDLNIIRRRLAAIKIAREKVAEKVVLDEKRFERKFNSSGPNLASFRRFFGLRRQSPALKSRTHGSILLRSENSQAQYQSPISTNVSESVREDIDPVSRLKNDLERAERLKEIDRLLLEGQKRISHLQSQKDFLQQQFNPLFNYSSENSLSGIEDFRNSSADTYRIFNFPSEQLVSEYIRELIDTRRLIKMNHTHLWRYEFDEDDFDDIGDDLLTPSGNSQKLYDPTSDVLEQRMRDRRNPNGPVVGGGSWLLRQSIGKGGSIGERLGETVETAAYRGICSAVMSFLARLIAQLHGLNVLMHSDVRLYMQHSPDLPPVSTKHMFDTENYAQETLRRVLRKSSKRNKGQRTYRSTAKDYFIQRNAVVETLLSHCQISAPLLQLFPLSWQRAMLGNCVTLTLAIIADFCENIQIPMLGHILSLSLQPITEEDILQQIGTNRLFFNHRFAKPVEFEAAVSATALDISESLKFLDRWHERALGSDLLRAQLGNLIARLVLTLVDEILCGTRIDLWTSQAGGPRLLLGLQYK